MGKFTAIPESTFSQLQTNAGVLLKKFDPANPELINADIICATTGGINPSCVPRFVDNGEDIDNCPNGMKELMEIEGWDCSLGFTALSFSAESIKMALGAADLDAETSAITPRMELKDTDFSDVWWVGDRSDDGLVAVCLKNALSTSGLSIQTTKNGKGQLAVTLGGHYSITAQKEVPMKFYSMAPSEEANTEPEE